MKGEAAPRKTFLNWSTLFAVWAVQGAAALWTVLRMPADPDSAGVLGLSPARLIEAAALVLWVAAALILSIRTSRNVAWRARYVDGLVDSGRGDVLLMTAALVCLGAEAALATLWGLSRWDEGASYGVYAMRLQPALRLLSISAVEFAVWMAYLRRNALRGAAQATRDLLRRSLVVWGVLAVVAAVIAVTGLGIVPDKTGDWGLPAVALLEWQILLACALAVAVM